jgi:hypothetical protein
VPSFLREAVVSGLLMIFISFILVNGYEWLINILLGGGDGIGWVIPGWDWTWSLGSTDPAHWVVP